MTDDDYRDQPHAGEDPAAAFERLRGEVSLLRSAIEGLTAARESIDIPDSEPTLARTEQVLTDGRRCIWRHSTGTWRRCGRWRSWERTCTP